MADDDVIEHAVVSVGPDLTGFRTSLNAQLKKALAGADPELKVKLEFDDSDIANAFVGLRAKMLRENQKLTRNFNETVQRAELQAYAASEKMAQAATRAAEAEQRRRTSTAQGESDKRARAAEAEGSRVARAAEKAAEQQRKAFKSITTGPKIIDYGGAGIRPVNLLYGAVAALTPALFAMSSSALQASTSVAALGAAGIGAALGIGGLVVAFNGLSDLLALRKTAQAEKVTQAANAVANANAVVDAVNAEVQAEKDLHDARRDAARDLVDLKQKTADLQNQQKDDTLSVAEAEEKRNKVFRNYFASSLDRARAQQDVANAKQKLSDTTLSRKETKEDLADSVKKGVEGSDKVVAARERLRQARARAAEARSSAGTGKASSAAANLADKLKKSSPALQDLYKFIDKNADSFTNLGNQIQQAFLPGFTTFLEEVSKKPKGGKSTLQFFTDQSAQLGKIISDDVAKIGAFTQTPFFRDAFGEIQRNNATALTKLGDAMLVLAKPVLTIIKRASPLLVRFADGFGKFADYLAKVIDKADKSGALAEFFKHAGDQLGHFLGIGKNLLTLLGGLFKAAVPTGDSLVIRLEKFTKTMSDFVNSSEGQKKVTAFFEFFRDLKYGDIARAITKAIELFAAYRVFQFAKSGPLALLFTALTTLAASHPGAAATFLEDVGKALDFLVDTVVKHPEAAAVLTGLLAGGKVAKTIGFDIKIPVITQLRDALTSRFKVLEKFVGGGASTATMTVQAGVVNVYGGAGAALPGAAAGGKGAKPGAKPGATTAVGGIAATALTVAGGIYGASVIVDTILGGKSGNFLDGVKSLALGPESYAQWSKENAPGFRRFFSMTLPNWITAGGTKGWSGFADAFDNTFGIDRNKQQESFNKAQYEAITTGNVYAKANPNDNGAVLKKGTIAQYISDRQKAVDAEVAETKAKKGSAAASKLLAAENEASSGTLSTLLQYYGYSKEKADAYGDSVFHVWKETDKAATKSDNTKTSVHNLADTIKDAAKQSSIAAGEMHALNARTGEVSKTIAGVVGTHTIQITEQGYDETYKKLLNMFNAQHVLYDPTYSNSAAGADTKSSQSQYIDPATGLPKKYMAFGGRVTGSSPHDRADNIPAMLTAGEFVQPVDTVKHYGPGFMEAVRTKQFPRFASGGQVWPVKVKMDDIPVPDFATYIPSGGGVVSGDEGIAEQIEAVGRSLGATDKQLISAIETGLVESGLRNLNYGDRDSLGVFQQRPSQGWGSPAQVTNVVYAATQFYKRAFKADNGVLTSGQLAQAVQRSKYPDRYDQRYADAVAILNRSAPLLAGGGTNLSQQPYTGNVNKNFGKVTNVSQAIYAAIADEQANFPGSKVTSTYRPGSVTLSGNASYHSRNPSRAADFGNPSMNLFNYFLGKYGAYAREIIYGPANGRTIKDGRPHSYKDNIVRQHANHVHLALAEGGMVPTRKYDTGGVLPPGFTMAYNGTGRNETIRTEKQENALSGPMRLHRSDIALLATNIAAASNQTVQMDGRKVAEVTNGYTYLPAGV